MFRSPTFSDVKGKSNYGKGRRLLKTSPGPLILFAVIALGLLGIGAATQINLTSQVQGVLPTANGGTGQNSTATFPTSGTVMTGSSSVACTQEPALTGDVTTSAGSCADTVVKIENAAIPASAGLVGTNSSSQVVAATETNIDAEGYAAGGGTAQAQTLTLSPAVTSLTNGLDVCWLPAAANTGSGPTLAVSGLTAKTIIKVGGAALAANDLTTTAIACAIYDGTSFELQNPQNAAVAINFSNGETPTGTCPTTSLTLAHTPVTDSLNLFYNGQLLTMGSSADYTLSTATITLTASCPTGTIFQASYRY